MDDKSSVDTAIRPGTPDHGIRYAVDLLNGLMQQTEAWALALESAQQELLGGPPSQRLRRHETTPSGAAEFGVGGEAAVTMLTGALARAESAVTLVDPGGEAGWLWPAELEHLAVAAVRRGCVVRAMFGRHPLCRPARQIAVALNGDRDKVRITGTPGFPIIIVDALVALAPQAGVDPDAAPAMAAIASPGVVRLLRSFADLAWGCAEPRGGWPGEAPLRNGTNAELKRRLVELLATGAKDERIARMLGISLRTCRRYIAEIMSELGAGSRFQAGVNAARVGLVSARPIGAQRPRRRTGSG